MSTAAEIIDRALQKLNVSSDMNPADAEQIDEAFGELKSFLARLRVESIDIGDVDPDAQNVQLYEPADVTPVLVNNLAVLVAASFQVPVPADIAGMARKGMDYLYVHYKPVLCEDRPLNETLPAGGGSYYPYFRKGQRIGHF